jgi:hypothetical protein
VTSALLCFFSQNLVNWVNENEETLKPLICGPPKENSTHGHTRLLNMVEQANNTTFSSWMNSICGADLSPSGTLLQTDVAALRGRPESHIPDDLADCLASVTKNDQVEAIQGVEESLHEMDSDENMPKLCRHHLELVEEAGKHQQPFFTFYHAPTHPQPSSSLAVVASTATETSSSTFPKLSSLLRTKIDIPPGYRFPSKLSESERELLYINNGCRVCRQLFAGHSLPCNILPTDASIYKPITQEIVNEARIRLQSPLAATYTDRTTTPVEDLDSLSPVAAVLSSPSVPFNLGNGSFSTDEVGLLLVKHLIWKAETWTPLDTLLPHNCLIETTTHLNCLGVIFLTNSA